MTTAEIKADKRSFFSIYKPGQGMYVRWGTVIGAGIITLTGALWIFEVMQKYDIMVQAISVAVWIAIFGVLTFWIVNNARLAEFMIMTESEMRKVTWPSRKEVFTSTKIVIFLTLLLGLLLFLVDVGFQSLFVWLKIY